MDELWHFGHDPFWMNFNSWISSSDSFKCFVVSMHVWFWILSLSCTHFQPQITRRWDWTERGNVQSSVNICRYHAAGGFTFKHLKPPRETPATGLESTEPPPQTPPNFNPLRRRWRTDWRPAGNRRQPPPSPSTSSHGGAQTPSWWQDSRAVWPGQDAGPWTLCCGQIGPACFHRGKGTLIYVCACQRWNLLIFTVNSLKQISASPLETDNTVMSLKLDKGWIDLPILCWSRLLWMF